MELAEGLELRDYRDGDDPGIAALVGAVYGEYGDICEPEADGYDCDLLTIRASFIEPGGYFAVIIRAGCVVGSVGVLPKGDGRCELKRLYLDRGLRGQGLGRRLMASALTWARANAQSRMYLWSDVRFKEAHGLYERLGFQGDERTRLLPDINETVERSYELNLGVT